MKQDQPEESLCFQALLELPSPLIIVAEDEEVVLANRALLQSIGCTSEELKTLSDWTSIAYREHAEVNRQRIMKMFDLRTSCEQYYETYIQDRNGKEQLWTCSVAPLQIPGDARRYLIVTATDVTVRANVERELRHSERRFRQLFEYSPDAVFIESHQGIILDVNPSACRMLGYERDAMIGMHASELAPPHRRDFIDDNFPRMTRGEYLEFESHSLTKDGREIPVDIRVSNFNYDDEPALLLHVRDITQAKRTEREVRELNNSLERRVTERTEALESAYNQIELVNLELRELDRLKSTFIAITSHETRAPLTIARGMLGILHKELETTAPELLRFSEPAERSAMRLERIVNRALEIIQSDQFHGDKLNCSYTDVQELIREVCHEVEPFIDRRHQELQLVETGPLPKALVDRVRIVDVMENLIMNAIKFTPDEGIIMITTSRESDDHIEIEVRDTGVGIAESDKPHIFKEFFTTFNVRTHSSGVYEFGKRGIGFGLAIVKRFIEMHGGSIRMESHLGEGSCFTVRLPIDGPPPQAEETARESPLQS